MSWRAGAHLEASGRIFGAFFKSSVCFGLLFQFIWRLQTNAVGQPRMLVCFVSVVVLSDITGRVKAIKMDRKVKTRQASSSKAVSKLFPICI